MDDLIESLQILRKYGNPSYPFHCEHDELSVHGFEPQEFSEEDKKRLQELGFEICIEGELCDPEEPDGDTHDETKIYSFKYGSC